MVDYIYCAALLCVYCSCSSLSCWHLLLCLHIVTVQIQPEYGDEQADAGRDCRTLVARPNSQARTNADRAIFIFPVQVTTCRNGNLTYPVDPYSCYMCDHTDIHGSSSSALGSCIFRIISRSLVHLLVLSIRGAQTINTCIAVLI